MQNTRLILGVTLKIVISIMLTTSTLCAQQTGRKQLNAPGLSKPLGEQPDNICLIAGLNDRLVETAYKDACKTLLAVNPCSWFFGGPGVAIEALNNLVKYARKSALMDRHIGMRMSGIYHLVPNDRSGDTYRLFEKATINLNGPFYNEKSFPSQPWVPKIGPFKPNSREARATILLHELGHMMRGKDEIWLLPDDSNDVSRSSNNTDLIIKHCGGQIKMLSQQAALGTSR